MFVENRDPAALATEHLEHEITQLAAHIYAATCRWLCLVAEFERRECHRAWGFHSTTAWLAWTCGLTPRAAREHVRVARDLASLPLICDSFGRGELSYSKVRALTRAASAETEAELLELAHNATAFQLERTVRAYRSALAVKKGEPPADTFFAWSWEDDGTLSVRGRLSADQGALLIEAMRHGHDLVRNRELPPAEHDRPAPPPTNVDALAAAAEASLASTESRSGGDRYQVVLHLDQNGRHELDDGSAVSEAAARRILCDAAVVALAESDGVPLSVGRRTRTISASLRRALRSRDGGCRFPGCGHQRFVDAHHIEHWADGGETSAENLVQLCRRHHRLIHEGGFSVERGADGSVRFRRPGGTLMPQAALLAGGDARTIVDASRPPLRQPSGDRLDLELTVDCMIQRAERAQREREAQSSVSCSPARPASLLS